MRYKYITTKKIEKDIIVNNSLSLEELQKLVGGNIEFTIHPLDKQLQICLNEEGRLLGLESNFLYGQHVGNIIVGKLVKSEFVGVD